MLPDINFEHYNQKRQMNVDPEKDSILDFDFKPYLLNEQCLHRISQKYLLQRQKIDDICSIERVNRSKTSLKDFSKVICKKQHIKANRTILTITNCIHVDRRYFAKGLC